jgi:hypothetical protein
MKRIRATVDLYYDMGPGDTEDDAIEAINQQIDDINMNYRATDSPVSASDIIQYEEVDEDGYEPPNS